MLKKVALSLIPMALYFGAYTVFTDHVIRLQAYSFSFSTDEAILYSAIAAIFACYLLVKIWKIKN